MLYLLTGTPGSGKTLRAVELIEQFLKQGRAVYTNIDSLNLVVKGADGVVRRALTFEECPQDANHSYNGEPLIHPDERPSGRFDWRRAPQGSVIVYDEAQQWFPATGRPGRSADTQIQAMEIHRHLGFDLILVTQHPMLISSHVRRLVNRHEHLYRVYGMERSDIYWRDRCWDPDSPSERKSANREHWTFPQRLFSAYRSASMHVKHKRIPRMVKVYLAVLVVIGLALVWMAWRAAGFFSGAPDVEVATDNPAVSTPASVTFGARPSVVAVADPLPVSWEAQDWVGAAPVARPVAGCIASSQRCRCYASDGSPLVIDTSECMRRVREPMPYRLGVFRSAGEGGRVADSAPADRVRSPNDF